MNNDFRIGSILKEKGMTQTELAEKIGISRVGLSKAINGNTTITTLKKIADALEVPITALFDTKSDGFTALVDNYGELHRFDSVEALHEFVLDIRVS